MATKVQIKRQSLRDHDEHLPPLMASTERYVDEEQTINDNVQFVSSSIVNPERRLHCMEKDMAFLRVQHAELIQSLHKEIEQLNHENKELAFELSFPQQTNLEVETKDKPNQENANIGQDDKLKALLGEVTNLRQSLTERRRQNQILERKIEERNVLIKELRQTKSGAVSGQQDLPTQGGENNTLQKEVDRIPIRLPREFELEGPLRVKMDPLLVKLPTQAAVRRPTVKECELIIKRLYKSYKQTEQELAETVSRSRGLVEDPSPRSKPQDLVFGLETIIDSDRGPDTVSISPREGHLIQPPARQLRSNLPVDPIPELRGKRFRPVEK